MDVLGPLPETEQQNKYLLIVADYFTKWTEAFPIRDQEATIVADMHAYGKANFPSIQI